MAFAMVYGGTAGETARQMADALHYNLPPAQFHPAFNALDLDLAHRPAQSAYVDEDERFQLSIANSTWAQKDYSFLPAYLDLLALNYGAGMHLMSFRNAPEVARRQINNWVSEQTNQRILDILPKGSVEPRTALVLTNAIYFKARWAAEFNPGFTGSGPFHLLDGSTVDVPYMQKHPEENYPYAEGDGWKAVSLPYKGALADMVILLPDRGTFNEFEASLTAEKYQAAVSALKDQKVILSLPKFKFDAGLGLKDALVGMGMQDAFTENVADLSGMDGTHLLFLSDAFHKAFIAVDEKGTEAAAATAVLAVPAFHADRRRYADRPAVPFLHPGCAQRDDPLHGTGPGSALTTGVENKNRRYIAQRSLLIHPAAVEIMAPMVLLVPLSTFSSPTTPSAWHAPYKSRANSPVVMQRSGT